MKNLPIIRWFFRRQRTIASIAILTILMCVGIFAFGGEARADCSGVFDIGCYVNSALAFIFNQIIYLLGWILLTMIAAFLWIAEYNDFINSIAVVNGWVVVRDVANMFFVVILLVAAVGTIFNLPKYSLRGTFVRKFILIAILVNFSRTICGIMIDAAQVFMLTFVGAIAGVGAGNFSVLLGLPSFTSFVSPDANTSAFSSVLGDPATNFTALVAAYGLAAIMLIVATVVIGVMLCIIVVRIVALWFLVAISPLALVASLTPKGERFYKQWWEEFFNYLIVGPAMAFFLWLSFSVVAGVSQGLSGDNVRGASLSQVVQKPDGASAANIKEINSQLNVGGTIAGTVEGLSGFVFGIVLLIASLKAGTDMGGMAGKIAGSAAAKIKDYTIGKPMRAIQSTAKKAAGTALGLGASTARGIGRNIVQGARKIPGVSTAAGAIGAKMEQLSKTPYMRVLTARGRAQSMLDFQGKAAAAREEAAKNQKKAGNVVADAAKHAQLNTEIATANTDLTTINTDLAAAEAAVASAGAGATAAQIQRRDELKEQAAIKKAEVKKLQDDLSVVGATEEEAAKKRFDFNTTALQKENEAQRQDAYALGMNAVSGLSRLGGNVLKFAGTGGLAYVPQVLAAAENAGSSMAQSVDKLQAEAVKKKKEGLKGKSDAEILELVNGIRTPASAEEEIAAIMIGFEKKLFDAQEVEKRRNQAIARGANQETRDALEEPIVSKYIAQSIGATDKAIKGAVNNGKLEAGDLKVANIKNDQKNNTFIGIMNANDNKRNELVGDLDDSVKEALREQGDKVVAKLVSEGKHKDATGEFTEDYKKALGLLAEAGADTSRILKINPTGGFDTPQAKAEFLKMISSDRELAAKLVLNLPQSVLASSTSGMLNEIESLTPGKLKAFYQAMNETRRSNKKAYNEKFEVATATISSRPVVTSGSDATKKFFRNLTSQTT